MSSCTHIKGALRRHGSPGTFLWVMLFLIIFGPRTFDAATGEPDLINDLAIVQDSIGDVLVQDVTRTRRPVYGVRSVTIENDDGNVICSTEHHNTWTGERNRFWRLSAITGCAVPAVPYRVCSAFSVRSDSGRQRYLGPFCSPVTGAPG